MDVLGKMRVNDKDTGELLAKVEAVFTCDECEDLDEFKHAHAEDIEEFLINAAGEELPEEYEGIDVIARFDLVELSEDGEDEDTDDYDEEEGE